MKPHHKPIKLLLSVFSLALLVASCSGKECPPGHFGQDCFLACTCKNGTCNDGISGDGKCRECTGNYWGENCDKDTISCLHGVPNIGVSGNGTCSSCATGWDSQNCDVVADGYMFDTIGKPYKTVVIDGLTWMAENMASTLGNDGSSLACYAGDTTTDFINTFGCLYTHNDAQKVCPVGWHLPRVSEFQYLLNYVELNRTSSDSTLALLANQVVGNKQVGNDDFGFGALITGDYDLEETCIDGTTFSFVQLFLPADAKYWSEQKQPSLSLLFYGEELEHHDTFVGFRGSINLGSVRCIKDYNCVEHGHWNNKLGCVCDTGWFGVKCGRCAAGYSGPNCTWPEENYAQDNRDGQKYRTIAIGEQTWLAENMRYAGVTHYSADGNSDNDAIYGYLYQWEDAKQVCPAGWHLPTQAELDQLVTYAGGKHAGGRNLCSISTTREDGNGIDKYGFGALPAGYYYSGSYYDFGYNAYFWSSTEYGSYAYSLLLDSGDSAYVDGFRTDGNSVRCLKD